MSCNSVLPPYPAHEDPGICHGEQSKQVRGVKDEGNEPVAEASKTMATRVANVS